MKRIIKKTFIPHHIENPRPIFWHPISIVVLVFTLLFLSGFLTSSYIDTQKETLLGDIKTGVILSLTNKERKANHVSVLQENEQLNEAARLKAQDMVLKGYFAHYSPEGVSPWSWIQAVGYEYQKAGENLAVNFDDSKEVVTAWMNSPTHRENIVKEGYTQIGIGTATGTYKGKNATFVVQMFASPKQNTQKAFAFSIEKNNSMQNQSFVQGISITKFDQYNIKEFFNSKEYMSILMMGILLCISIFALIVVMLRKKHHSKKFYISISIVFLLCGISIYSIILFFQHTIIQIQI